MTMQLATFSVDGLFGQYSHVIDLNTQHRVTIIIGPNGRGKTVCLKLIEALFKGKFGYMFEIPFSSMEFRFTDSSVVQIRSKGSKSSSTLLTKGLIGELEFKFIEPDGNTTDWTPKITTNAERELRRVAPSWQRQSWDVWIDDSDGEVLESDEFFSRYRVPTELRDALKPELPSELAHLIKSVKCHLIETQRLLILPSVSNDRGDLSSRYFEPPRGRARESGLTVKKNADTLKSILQRELGQYAAISQQRDRSFPLRVFNAQEDVEIQEAELREGLKQLDERRTALMDLGILDADNEPVSIRDGEIESGVARALRIYVDDAKTKLDTLTEIRDKIALFRKLVNARFIDKKIQIDRESGFNVLSNNNTIVPIEKLSSGEQHQLILIFDLLFAVEKNSFILIDEPELSLHVAWQRAFIDNLIEIITLNEFDVLLATHSPSLVANHDDLVVELGPVAGVEAGGNI